MRGKTTFHIRWKLFFYDVIVFAVTSVFLLVLYEGPVKLTQRGELQQMLLAFVCVFACRLVGKIYGQIWRYGGIQCYMRLVCTDCVAFLIYVILESVLPVAHISFPRLLVLSTVNTMGALIMRMSYRYAYKCSNLETFSGKILAALLKIFAGIEVGETRDDQKIKVAIIGAYIRLYSREGQARIWKILYIVCIVGMLGSKVIISACARIVPGVESYSEIFYSHSSIFVIGSAVALFMLFKDKQNRDTRFEKWILKISPLTFGVYLIHMNANLAKIYWGQLKYSLDANSYGIFLWYIVSTVIVFGISTIIDQIRNIGVKQIKNIFMRK